MFIQNGIFKFFFGGGVANYHTERQKQYRKPLHGPVADFDAVDFTTKQEEKKKTPKSVVYSFHYYAFNSVLKDCICEHGLFLVACCRLINIGLIKPFL